MRVWETRQRSLYKVLLGTLDFKFKLILLFRPTEAAQENRSVEEGDLAFTEHLPTPYHFVGNPPVWPTR